MGIGDVVAMLEHAYYSVISPESCASILWKDTSKKSDAAAAMKLNSENLLQLEIIDTVIKEPLGGAHHDPKVVYDRSKIVLNRSVAVPQKPFQRNSAPNNAT